MVGDGVGLWGAGWGLSRWSARRILIGASAVTAGAMALWLVTGSGAVAVGAMFMVGAGASLQWPLAKAAAFARLPRRPGVVNSMDSLANGADIVAPLALGAAASGFGLEVAMWLLLLQPVVVGGVAVAVGTGTRPGVPPGASATERPAS